MSHRIRRLTKAAVSFVFLALFVAACSSAGEPQSYSGQPRTLEDGTEVSLVEQNWMTGCTVGLDQGVTADDANQVCQCSFDRISGPDGIAFEDFVKMNNDLKGDPTSLESDDTLTANERQLVDIVKDCIAAG